MEGLPLIVDMGNSMNYEMEFSNGMKKLNWCIFGDPAEEIIFEIEFSNGMGK